MANTLSIGSEREEEPIRLHPGLADVCRAKVADLTEALSAPETRHEAAEIIQGMISEIRLIPEADGHAIELAGALAAIMPLGAMDSEQPRAMGAGVASITEFAVVGLKPTTFRL